MTNYLRQIANRAYKDNDEKCYDIAFTSLINILEEEAKKGKYSFRYLGPADLNINIPYCHKLYDNFDRLYKDIMLRGVLSISLGLEYKTYIENDKVPKAINYNIAITFYW